MEVRTALWNKLSFNHVGPWVKTQVVRFLLSTFTCSAFSLLCFYSLLLLNLFSGQKWQMSLESFSISTRCAFRRSQINTFCQARLEKLLLKSKLDSLCAFPTDKVDGGYT